MKEGKIVVEDVDDQLFFTAQIRRVFFIFRGPWIDLKPEKQPAYWLAKKLMINKMNKK